MGTHTPFDIAFYLVKSYVVISIMYFHEIYYRYFGKRKMLPDEEENIQGEVVLITGASRGMGKAAAEEFAKRGATVVLGCVDTKEGQEAVEEIKQKTGNENVEMIFLDLAEMASVQTFAVEVNKKYPKIKVMVNNAGIPAIKGKQHKTIDGFNITVAVNHLGHFLLTNLLSDNLKRGSPSRVIAMSSTMQLFHELDVYDLNMDKSGFGFQEALPYSNTKFANALFMKELGKRMKEGGVSSYALCPGAVKTTIFEGCNKVSKKLFAFLFTFLGFTPEEAASEFVLYHALSKNVAHESGLMYRFKSHFTTANYWLKDTLAKDLWDVSANLVKLEERREAFRNA